jgi:hypothetical protein
MYGLGLNETWDGIKYASVDERLCYKSQVGQDENNNGPITLIEWMALNLVVIVFG